MYVSVSAASPHLHATNCVERRPSVRTEERGTATLVDFLRVPTRTGASANFV